MKPHIAVTAGPDDVAKGNTKQVYRDAVTAAGGEPVLLTGGDPRKAAELLAGFDGLLLSGGPDFNPAVYGGRPHPTVEPDSPERDALEIELARVAKRSGIPTLAICRGMQTINVALGGTMYEDIAEQFEPRDGLRIRHQQVPDFSRRDTTHDVDIVPGSTLREVAGSASVRTNSLHHQAVRRIAHCLNVVAAARDGVVEALELQGDHPFYIGVQWHPEELFATDEPSRRLFARFIEAAARRAGARPPVATAT